MPKLLFQISRKSVELTILPRFGALTPASESPASPAATRHQERTLFEPTVQKSRQNLLDVPAGLGNDLNAGGGKRPLERPGDRSAYQHRCAMAHEQVHPCLRLCAFERQVPARLLRSAGHINQQYPAGYVEYRADPALPVRYGDSHQLNEVASPAPSVKRPS